MLFLEKQPEIHEYGQYSIYLQPMAFFSAVTQFFLDVFLFPCNVLHLSQDVGCCFQCALCGFFFHSPSTVKNIKKFMEITQYIYISARPIFGHSFKHLKFEMEIGTKNVKKSAMVGVTVIQK